MGAAPQSRLPRIRKCGAQAETARTWRETLRELNAHTAWRSVCSIHATPFGDRPAARWRSLTGRSLSRAIRDPAAPWSERGLKRRARDADGWLRLALRIDPERGWAHLQRARLFDADKPALDDPAVARAAYEAFLDWQAGSPPERVNPPGDDDPKVLLARERLRALE